jgi:ankyrin repeat protein
LEDVEILKLLVEYNTDVFSQDILGQNAWHYYAVNEGFHVSILDILLKIAMERELESLLVEDADGFTPLELCFEEDLMDEEIVLFIGYCDKIPNFWQDHRCVFPIAARRGYKSVLKKLMDLNVIPKAIGPNEMSPLHELGRWADLETVTILKTLYPAACQLRVGDHTPLEHYLNNILCGPKCASSGEVFIPDKSVIHSLYCKPPSESSQIDSTESWKFTCRLLAQCIQSCVRCTQHIVTKHNQVIGKSIIEVMMDLGAMKDYESLVGLSGVKLLFEAVLVARKNNSTFVYNSQQFITMNTFKKAISSSQYWEPNSPWAIEFLRETIMCKDLAAVEYLLGNGLDLHQRLGTGTTIEYVCSGFIARWLCNNENGKALFQCLLNHSDPERLKGWDYKGLTLLHRVATQSNEPGLRWVIHKLVEMGLDINAFNSSPEIGLYERRPSLFYHIYQESPFGASVLLELGADPNLTTAAPNEWNSIMLAAFRGYTSVLNAALASSKKSGLKIRWEAPFPIIISTKDSQVEHGCTAIYAACFGGHLDCVKFFNEQRLLSLESLNSSQKTPLHFCAIRGFADIIKYLVAAGAKIDRKDTNGDTPLHLAAREGQIQTVKLLVELGATDGINKRFKSPALLASEFGHQEIAQFLEQEFGMMSHRESHQITAMSQIQEETLLGKLYPAIKNGNIEMCRLLLTEKCPLNTKISPYDCNPLQYSMSENQPEIAKMLLDHGASTLSNAWIIKNEYLAHCNYSIAVSAFSGEMLLPLLPNILSRFLEEGGDFLQLTNSLGPIPRALRSRNIQGVRTILEFLSENSVQIRYVDRLSNTRSSR